MANEFDLGGLRSALGLPKAKPSDSEPFKVEIRGTSVSKPDQSRRDADALKVLQDELEKEQKLAAKGNAVSARNVEALNREIARFGGKPAPQAAPQAAPQTTEAPSDSFNISGLKTALTGVATPDAQPPEPTTPTAPPVERMFKPKTEFERRLIEGVENLPGSKELGAFGNVAAGTITQSIGAVQQLVGKYFPFLSDEQRNAIVQNATQNVKQTQEAIKPFQEEFPKTALAGEVTGFIANPINKLVPGFGGPAQTLAGAVTKGFYGGVVDTLDGAGGTTCPRYS